MSQPVHDLQRIIPTQRQFRGRVVAITSDFVRIATPNGIIEIQDARLGIGDQVNIIGQEVRRHEKSTKNVTHTV